MRPQIGSSNEDRSISIGRDAIGNVLVTGNRNQVSLTLVVADQRLLGRLQVLTGSAISVDNPYCGLDTFYEADAPLFFGREKMIRRAWILFQKLQQGSGPRICAVVGASGSGKSSLVRAGLLPELARQPMDGLERPVALILRPGPWPLSRLGEVLAIVADGATLTASELAAVGPGGHFEALHRFLTGVRKNQSTRFVIVIDQFEELFTECADSGMRRAFLEGLAYAASHTDRLTSVVLTIRSDFASAVKTPVPFANAIRESRLVLQAMDRQELQDAIARPASIKGRPWPTPLVENLVAQAEGRAGALPLLQFTLKKLWEDHTAGRLDDAKWSSKLIEDFLVQAADALYETAGSADSEPGTQQKIIRRAFLSMVQLGEGAPDTRRIAPLSEFVAAGESAQEVRDVLAPFIAPDSRLITASEANSEPTYELTHEALIPSWDRLAMWLGNVEDKAKGETLRSDLRIHRKMSAAAKDWKFGRGGLWRPPELELLSAYVARAAGELTTIELEFVASSQDAMQKEIAQAERRNRNQQRLRWFRRIGIGAAIIIATAILLIRYGVERLSLEQQSDEETFVLKSGIDLLKPALGSDKTVIQFGKVITVAANGRTAFLNNGSILFSRFNRSRLFAWLDTYYLARLKESDSTSEVTEFWVEQINSHDKLGEEALLNALSAGSLGAHEVVRANHLTGQKYKLALVNSAKSSVLGNDDAQKVADSLNTLHYLFDNDLSVKELTNSVDNLCTPKSVRVLIALSYEPDSSSLATCASRLIATGDKKDAAALIIRFHPSDSTLLSTFKSDLTSHNKADFLSAANVMVASKSADSVTVTTLKNRLTDPESEIAQAAALTLWSFNIGTPPRVLDEVLQANQNAASMDKTNRALMESDLVDPKLTRYLERQLSSFGISSERILPPTAVEILNRQTSEREKVIRSQLASLPDIKDDTRRAIAASRLVALGCRDVSVTTILDQYIKSGVFGMMGYITMPEVAESYGDTLDNKDDTFDESLERLWGLLRSPRAEQSANYRLAVEFAISKLVLAGQNDKEIEERSSKVSATLQSWATDAAPHHRAAYVNTYVLIQRKIDRSKLMLRANHF